MTALTEAARRTIAAHETLVLSERDRAVFFDARSIRRRQANGCGGRSEDLRIVLLGEAHDRDSFTFPIRAQAGSSAPMVAIRRA
jgi:hypothetical protein